MFDFQFQLKMLPDKPGVYIMKNSLGEVIYIGKAKVLKNRVRQYFQSSKGHSEKVRVMVTNIAEFEYIVTDSEMEALILECNLIKKYKPRYNILLKDDKHFPFIKLTTNEDFPRIFISRNIVKDGARYFGPYTDAGVVYEIMELIKKLFPLRNCKLSIKESGARIRPCLNYQIGLCKGPCGGFISKKEYNDIVFHVMELLQGKGKDLLKVLKESMEKASENLDFEKAAELRDKILAVQKISEKQKIFNGNFENEDYIDIFADEKDSCVQVFFYRDGKLSGREHFMLENTFDIPVKEVISDFLKSFYGGTAFIPKSIYVPDIEEGELLSDWLTSKKGSRVEIKIPLKGEKKEKLNMVQKNARMTLEQFKNKMLKDKEFYKNTLQDLADLLELDDIPVRIEAFDISNIQGVDSVGGMVVFEGGKAKNSDYRRFKIKTVKGANDYDSMREILTRRFEHGIEEVKSIAERDLKLSAGKFCVFPDLILMDGGKGQVNVALEILDKYNINIPVCGMVKDDKHNTRGLIYNNTEMIISSNSDIMGLITRIQDEVHRFAITYHRTLRDRRVLHSVLEEVPNIGEKRRKELLKKFGSIEAIKKASLEEFLETPSIDRKAAESLIDYFQSNKNNSCGSH